MEDKALGIAELNLDVKGSLFIWIGCSISLTLYALMMVNLGFGGLIEANEFLDTYPKIFFSGFFLPLVFGFLINAFRHRQRFIWTGNNRHYKKQSERHILEKQAVVIDAIKNFKISSNYSNMYYQTQLSEYEVIGYIKDFNQVIVKRRSHRKFSSSSKELVDWIADTKWDQIVSISIDEFVNILSGVDLDFNSQTWAKREVMIWD